MIIGPEIPMPLHDWTRVDAERYHDFHNSGVVELRNCLNGGLLPEDCEAVSEATSASAGISTKDGPRIAIRMSVWSKTRPLGNRAAEPSWRWSIYRHRCLWRWNWTTAGHCRSEFLSAVTWAI